jgi:hypothetical protein
MSQGLIENVIYSFIYVFLLHFSDDIGFVIKLMNTNKFEECHSDDDGRLEGQ